MLILKADQIKHPNKSSELVLFTAVLTQAIHDSLYKGCSKYYIQYKIEAIKWLTGNSKDFKLICCLLYTSPSPRDGLLSRMPSSA